MRYHLAKKSLLCLAVLVCCNGCAMWSKEEKGKSKEESWFSSTFFKKEYQTPATMAAIWSPDILTMTGKPPTRGFGGRVYLYNAKSQAVPVDGELIVHGYNRKVRKNEETIEADKTFRFTAEQLTEHFSPSELGASYSIWIPWDAADGLRQEITLIPSFKDKTGAIVQGAPAKLYLPGRSEEPKQQQQRQQAEELPAPAQTVSYRQSSMPTNSGVELPKFDSLRAKESKRRITNIEVPRASTINRPQSTRIVAPQRDSFTLGGNSEFPQNALNYKNIPNGAMNQTVMPNANIPSWDASSQMIPGNRTPAAGMQAETAPAEKGAAEVADANDPNARAKKIAAALQRTAQQNGMNNVQALPASYGDVQLTPSKAIEMSPPNRNVNLKSPFAHAPYSMFR